PFLIPLKQRETYVSLSQNKMKKGSTYWIILERKIYHNLDDLEFENIEVYEEIKAIILKHV
ncbi:hypothetical protein, partial [Bacillus velezensis]|uniref:hypothetical protein n=1 Tax=Bacillus velezensis TaxID=492670 RepID=UPI002FFE1B46